MAQVNMPGPKKSTLDTALQGLQIAGTVSSIKNNNAQTDAIKRRTKKLEDEQGSSLVDVEGE